VKIAEARPGLVPLPCGGGSFHNVRGVLGVFAHRVADDLLAFPTIAVDGHNKPMPRGVGLVRIDADAPLEADRLVWMTDPQHAIDPAGAEYLQLCTGSANPPSNDAISVRWLDFVDTVNAEEEPQTLLYLACGSAWQVREYDITNVVGSGGFVPGAVIEIPFNPGIANGSDNLYWIAARHEPAQNVDLLYVAGRHHMYCVHRTLHSYQQTNHWLRNGEDMEGHVVVEQTLTTNGDREHVWTVAAETSHPWTIFDMTDRFHNPALEAPDVLEKRFAPGGCDGGVAVPELDSVYFGYFAGIARLDVGTMLDDGGAVPPAITPVYDSYQPAIVPAQGEQIIEQIDLIRFPGTTDPFRLFTPNGAGDILEWKIDTALPAFTKNPLPPTLIELDWGVSWPEAYANCATAGWSEHAQRPYLLVDYFTTGLSKEVRVGRYWPRYGGQNPVWQVLDVTAIADPEDKLQDYVKDIAIARDANGFDRWGIVALHNGIVVLDLGSASSPMDFAAVDTFYTVATSQDPTRLHDGNEYPDVVGVAGIPGTIAISAGKPSDAGAVIVLLAQDETTGQIANIDYFVWDAVGGVDGIPGTDFFKPGPLEFFQVGDGSYRLYAGCNFSGAVLEFLVEEDPYGTWLGTPDVWEDGTHPNAVSDIRPYPVGHPDGLPRLLVTRYRQTVAILAASETLGQQP